MGFSMKRYLGTIADDALQEPLLLFLKNKKYLTIPQKSELCRSVSTLGQLLLV